MLDIAEGLKHTLRVLRDEWSAESAQSMSAEDVRNLIEMRSIGTFVPLTKMDSAEIASFLMGKTVAGVDGSSATFGAGFPGTLSLLHAGAMSMTRKKVLLGDCTSPLSKKDQVHIYDYKVRFNLSEEEAYNRYKDERLASLEIMSASQLLKEEPPAVLMFDGGFVRYESKAGKHWEEYQRLNDERRVLSVGIIEEVGTNFIAQALDESFGSVPYDRHLLFGVLRKGEALLLNPALKQKGFNGNYYTCFARFSNHPSITGCDIFMKDRSGLIPLLRYLYTNTMETSRGVPFWIDRIDHEIKLSYKETEAVIRQSLPPAWVERYLVSQRSRRDI